MDGVGLTVTAIGAILTYSGIKGYSVLDVIRNVITGKPITDNVADVPIGGSTGSGASETSTAATGSPLSQDEKQAVGATAISNQELGKIDASSWGWDVGLEWQALQELWTRESSWDNHAKNPSSGAYGIPQALPYTKMPKEAWPESAGGQSDANTQIVWGLNYIDSRYRSPIFALAFHKTNGWY